MISMLTGAKSMQHNYFNGGVTSLSMQAWTEFRKLIPWDEGWRPERIIGLPNYPVTVEWNTHPANVVQLTFTKGPQQMVFATDGFSWGFSGTGVVGLRGRWATLIGSCSGS